MALPPVILVNENDEPVGTMENWKPTRKDSSIAPSPSS